MAKLVTYTPYIKTTCPHCKNEVNALKLDSKRLQIKETPWKNTIDILGCPDCRILFFQAENSEVARAFKE